MISEKIKTERIVRDLLEDLRDIPDGTVTDMEKLLAESDHAEKDFSEEEIALLQELLFEKAKSLKIEISCHGDSGFTVRNQAARYVCPFCGSTNTARIRYGLSDYTPRLNKKLKEKKIILGGCVIPEGSPDRYCNDCENVFNSAKDLPRTVNGSSPVAVSGVSAEPFCYADDPVNAEEVFFTYNVWGKQSIRITITKTDAGAEVVREEGPTYSVEPEKVTKSTVSPEEWISVIDLLYKDWDFGHWRKRYTNTKVLDGILWKITVRFSGSKEHESIGLNDYPPRWDEVYGFFMGIQNI